MPHLRGFTKTRIHNILILSDTDQHMQCTVDQYRRVVSFYLQVFHDHQELIGEGGWLLATETLTHRTAHNLNHIYPFDNELPNYPSGLRRAAIAEAYGHACAWKTSYDKWQTKKERSEERNLKRISGEKGPIEFTDHPPQFPCDTKDWPVFYGTTLKMLDSHHLMVKVFTGKAYVYRKITLAQAFIAPPGYACGSPSLIHRSYGWELHVPIILREKVDLKKIETLVKDKDLRICVVDLGINHHAVATIQDTKGRVYATLFISGAKDNRLRKRYLEKIVNLQMETKIIPKGERFARDLWDKISNLNDHVAHYVSKKLVEFATTYGAKIIVFEHLGRLKPSKGTKSHWFNQKFIFWVKGRTVKYARYKALHKGIITCRVSPKNTSTRCPYCGTLTIIRYNKGTKKGVALAQCTNCKTHDVNSDYVGSLGIGTAFRLKHCCP